MQIVQRVGYFTSKEMLKFRFRPPMFKRRYSRDLMTRIKDRTEVSKQGS